MRKNSLISILICAISLLFNSVAHGQADTEKRRIAVYLTASDNVDSEVKRIVNNHVTTTLNRTGRYSLIERNEAFVAQINKERAVQHSGRVLDNQITALAKEFGAKAVCIVDLGSYGDELSVDMRMVSVEKTTVIHSGYADGRHSGIGDIRKIVDKAAADMLGTSTGSSGTSMGMSRNNNNAQRHPAEPEMIFVQGGTFWMGSAGGESDELHVHQVTVGDFSIGKYEVTQAQWRTIMGTTVSQQRDKADKNWPLRGEGDNYPIYYVSWHEAQEFVSRLNAATGKNYRLPTEAEWEYAARGGNKTSFCGGSNCTYSGSNSIESVAWYDGNSGSTTHLVGTKLPNELGIYDMNGNVWEWCGDWYGTYSASAQQDPMGASSGSYRVLRGGSWDSYASLCRVSYRNYYSPGDRNDILGFRLVLP